MQPSRSQSRHPARRNMLEVRVMSPRIAWFGFLKCAGRMTKLAGGLAVLAALGWLSWRGIQRVLYQNPDFRLQVIALNANPAIDELGLAAAAGIDLTANPSLFDLDLKELDRKLRRLPAIADVRVERRLPGTLAVTVTPRIPQAWVTCPAAGLTATRRSGALLVDREGVAYPCPEAQLESSLTLPVIRLPASADPVVGAGGKIRQPELESCFRLLEAAGEADGGAPQWIESVRQANEWSLLLVTRGGTAATFGLGDHVRQFQALRAALDHAGEKGYQIDTINLIPKYNIPITLREDLAPPRAIPVSIQEVPGPAAKRRPRDSRTLPKHN